MRLATSARVCMAVGLATAGCAAKALPPLDLDALRATRPLTLIVAADRSPPITAEGPAREGPDIRYAFGLLGAVMIADHDQQANRRRGRWMKGCQLDDRVEEIRDSVAEELASALSLHLVDSNRRTKAKAAQDVIIDYPGADLILDIRTSRWGIRRASPPGAQGKVHFAVGYEGTLRLIDARKAAVVAESTCSIQFSNGDDPPTITELLEDDCALLDRGLALDAATCTKRHLGALGLASTE